MNSWAYKTQWNSWVMLTHPDTFEPSVFDSVSHGEPTDGHSLITYAQ